MTVRVSGQFLSACQAGPTRRPAAAAWVWLVAACLWLAGVVNAGAQTYTWSTLAGPAGGAGSTDGTNSGARFYSPSGVAVDSNGNVYVADTSNHVIRKITSSGAVSTIAGVAGVVGSSDGAGTAARFNVPRGVALDLGGNLYVADSQNHVIRKITAGGMVSTLAGSMGVGGSVDGVGGAAQFNAPNGLALDGEGNVYVADSGNSVVRKITPAGEVSTLAGSAGNLGSADGVGGAAQFNFPLGVAVDASGNVFVADSGNSLVRKVSPSGQVSTLAGTAGATGNADGTGSAARFSFPYGLAVDGSGNVYVGDSSGQLIRKITVGGVVTTLAGAPDLSGSEDGIGAAARFNGPSGLAVDTGGNVFVADLENCAIRKVASSGLVSTFAGSAGGTGSTDGAGSAARFYTPEGIAVDGFGNVYVAELMNHVIRKVTSAGIVSTYAGSAGVSLYVDGIASAARFHSPGGVAVDAAGTLYVAEVGSNLIRKITSAGMVSTIAGGTAGESGSDDGLGTAARFNSPTGIAVDAAGTLYVTDGGNHLVRKITSAGAVTTLAGSPGVSGSSDGSGSAARFDSPVGVAVDGAGNVYVCDTVNHTIRKISGSGAVLTLAGSAGISGSADGTGTAARFNMPSGVAVDALGNLYVADTGNRLVRRISPAGVVSTIGGMAEVLGSVGGVGSAARFNGPFGIAVDAVGNVYFSDHFGSKICVGLVSSEQPLIYTPPQRLAVVQGGSAAFSVAAIGASPISYQWQKGGVNIPGATSSSYGIPSVQPADAGVYTVVVTNVAGSATSSVSTLTVKGSGAPTYSWSTFAGPPGGFGSSDGAAMAARFYNPSGVVMDGSGTLYVADTQNHVIRKITAGGEVTTFAGAPGVPGTTDGQGPSARFSQPVGVALDGSGNLYVSDSASHLIRKVSSTGMVSTFAGFANTSGSADGTGTAARFKNPCGLAVDAASNVYVADQNNHTIRKITSGGGVSTFAGTALSSGSLDATGSAARFCGPYGLAVDASGNVYVGDSANHVVRKITSGGVVSTLAGTAGASGSLDATGAVARFYYPLGVSVDSGGNVYVCDSNRKIRKVTSAGVVTTLAGSGLQGSEDGSAGVAKFDSPYALTLDPGGSLYVADKGNHMIRKVTSGGDVSTVAGANAPSGNAMGTRYVGRFNEPTGVAVDGLGNVYTADRLNNKVRKVLYSGVVTNFAGSGTTGSLDGTGTGAQFTYPSDLALDASGNVYVADTSNQVIRKITSAGVVTTFAGSAGLTGSTDGTGSGARFSSPQGVAVDGGGNVYVGDTGNHVVRKITSAGVVTTLAGSAGFTGSTDATGSAARFNQPTGVAVDVSGNVYVADAVNAVIRKISSAGVVSTFAGSAGATGAVDGTGSAARFRFPTGVAVDGSGNVFVSESVSGYVVRKITSGGVVSTIGGADYLMGCDDGVGTNARFMRAARITVDDAGNLYVGDSMNHKLRFGASSAAPPVLYTPPESLTVAQGGSASLSVTAAGFTPIFYQWRLNGFPIAGGTSSTLTIGSVQASDGGVYDVLMFNSGGMTTSLSGTLTVNSPPSILVGPGSLTVTAGSSATLSVAAAGTLPLSYQWRKDGADIAGGTASSYAIPVVSMSDAGAYTVTVANAFGSVTSANAMLTLMAPVTITSQPGSLKLNSGSSGTLNVGATGTPPIHYQWRKNGTVIPGANAASFSLVSAGTLDSGIFDVVVSNAAGSVTSSYASVGVFAAVSIVNQPTGGNVVLGGSWNFVVAASGTQPVGYQWRKNGIPILAGTESASVSTVSGGIWGYANGPSIGARFNWPTQIASDSAGNIYVADSRNHNVRVLSAGTVSTLTGYGSGYQNGSLGAAKFNDPEGIAVDRQNNIYVSDSGNHVIRKISSGTVSTLAGSPGVSGITDGRGDSARFNCPQAIAIDSTGNLFVADRYNSTIRRVTPSGDVTTFAGLGGVAGSANGVGASARFNSPIGIAIDGADNLYVVELGNHSVRKITPDGTVTTFAGMAASTGTSDGVGTNARFLNPQAITADPYGYLYVADTDAHTVRRISPSGVVRTIAGAPLVSGGDDGPGGSARFNLPRGLVFGPGGNLYVSELTNCTIRLIALDPLISGAGPSLAVTNAQLAQSGDYDVLLWNPVSSVSSGSATLTVNTPLTITSQPASVTVNAGSLATLSVSASGTTPVTYQWRKDGSPISGGTAAAYVLASAQPLDAGTYDVVLSNVVGSVTSNPAVLNVNTPVTIISQPESVNTIPGVISVFSVTASSTTPMVYQWQKDGVNINGGTGSSYAIPSVVPTDAGVYKVLVTNLFGSVVSGTATLGVYTPVSITSSPVGGRFAVGATVPLSVSASGSGPFSYQWRKDGESIPGGTGPVLVLSSFTHRSAGVYDVLVSNPASSAFSEAALVTANLASIRGATTNLTFDLPPALSPGGLTSVYVLPYPAGTWSVPLLSYSVVSNGTVSVNLRNLTASGDYFLRLSQIGLDGQSVSADTVPFGLTVHSWSEGAGNYEALLEAAAGESPDGAAYRGMVQATVSPTGAISGRVQYVEAPPLLDEAGQNTGLRAYSPVTRAFSGALAPRDSAPLSAVFLSKLGSGADLGRQEIGIELDYSTKPARLTAQVRDSASANPSVWTSATAPTLATAMRLESAVTATGTIDVSDLAGLFNLASDHDSVDPKNNGYVLAQVGRSARVMWRTRFLGRNGIGSGILNVDDPEFPAVTLYQWSALQPAGLFHSSVLMGRLNFERSGDGAWRMNAGSSPIGAHLERQGTYARRFVAGSGVQTVYSEGLGASAWNGTAKVGFEAIEGVRWGFGASNPTPYSITRDSNGQVFRAFNILSVMPDFFRGTGMSRTMRLTLEDPEVDGLGNRPVFDWNVTVSTGGQLKAEPVQGSGAPPLSLKLDFWYGEISGVYVRNGVRRSLFGAAVPSQVNSSQTGRGWIEKGAVPSVQRGEWILIGSP